MVKQDDRNAILFACLSIHEGSPVHVNPLGNPINISISHRSVSRHLVWFRQTHRIACRSVGRVEVLPRRKHRPDQTVSLPLSAVPHYCHRQKESVPSRQDPTYSDSRRATPSAPKLSIDPRPTAGGVRLLSGR